MARDPLRSTLDNLKVDPGAEAERPYLESALRRMGYSEAEIQARLGGAPAPTARPTEYRLVKPILATGKPGLQSPFEDLQPRDLEFTEKAPVDFDAVEATNEEFEEIPAEPEPVEFQETAPEEEMLEFEEFDVTFEEVPEEAARKERARQGLLWDDTQGGEPIPAEDRPIDTFGDDSSAAGAMAPRTRVRVRRVRAKSRSEAEAKVAGQGRRVIKSIPVDIVERWGPGESREKGAR